MWFWILATVILLFGFVAFLGAPYVPSKRRELRHAFEHLYPLGRSDVLVDIGSGDGVVLREAAKRGARAIGYELNPVLAWFSRWISRRYKGIEVHVANMWNISFPEEVTVVYVFAVSRDSKKLEGMMQSEANRMKKSLKLISYGCKLPSKIPIKTSGAHFLYDFLPLQG